LIDDSVDALRKRQCAVHAIDGLASLTILSQHGFAFTHDELDRSAGHEAEPFPNFNWNRDLALGRDSAFHGKDPYALLFW
jgi:hypothetical protein